MTTPKPIPEAALDRLKTDPDRFWQRVDKSAGPDECWPYQGEFNNLGYGRFVIEWNPRRVRVLAHRLSFELTYGIHPTVVMHSCDNPPCCNPNHLTNGTQSDNLRDAEAKGRLKHPLTDPLTAVTHCPYGHPYDEKNTYTQSGGGRGCRECQRRRWREWNERKRNAARPLQVAP